MKLEDRIRADLTSGALAPLPGKFRGVSKDRIRQVLGTLDRGTPDQVDAVFALLDDHTPSWFKEAAARGSKFCHGASTAHIACHIGVFQRYSGKLDREGRDYWLKPLWEIGALEKVTFDAKAGSFIDGHPVAKSPNSAYRITKSFLDILTAADAEWRPMLAAWSTEDATRARLQIQAALAGVAKAGADTRHEKLIAAACKEYAPRFLPGYEVLYIDAGDGDRITAADREKLRRAGLEITLGDSMPDVLLWSKETDGLWVIEAVCSDGEVDMHKVESLRKFAARFGKPRIGFTTAYCTWKDASARQGKHKNVAPDTFIWIQEDGTKQFAVETFKAVTQGARQS